MSVVKKTAEPSLGKTTHTFFYDISKEGKAALKMSVSESQPGNLQEMHRSLKSGQYCYRHEGRYVMMSRRDGEQLGLKPIPLREGWKTFQELNGKDVALGARPDRSLAGLERRAAPKAVAPRPKASPVLPAAAARSPAGPEAQPAKPAVAYRDKDREVIRSKDGRKITVESEIVLYGSSEDSAADASAVAGDKERGLVTTKDGRKIETESEVKIFAKAPENAESDSLGSPDIFPWTSGLNIFETADVSDPGQFNTPTSFVRDLPSFRPMVRKQ
ncbi:hypothetical protein FBR05_14880 [Deltaproteobacteria bacterium PRO3]|nr:hypothetical protein [Deltaproteobacteria bacterium PRO3]